MYRGKRISVVIPCHNEEDGIAAVLDQMPPIVDEVVVVDNCSTDNTAKVATERGARVVPEKRKGYGFAHKTGYAAARGKMRRWKIFFIVLPLTLSLIVNIFGWIMILGQNGLLNSVLLSQSAK